MRAVRIPVGLIEALAGVVGPFDQNAAGFTRFFAEVLTRDMVGDQVDDQRLEAFYRQLAGEDSVP